MRSTVVKILFLFILCEIIKEEGDCMVKVQKKNRVFRILYYLNKFIKLLVDFE